MSLSHSPSVQKEPNTVGWYDNAVSLACRDWPFRSLLLWWAGITEHLMLTVPNGKLPHKPASTETNKNWESKCYIFYSQWARTLMDLWGMRFAGGWLGSGPRFQISLSGESALQVISSLQSPSLSVRWRVTTDVSGLLANVIPDLFVLLVKVYLESWT